MKIVNSQLSQALMEMMIESCPNVVRASCANVLNSLHNSEIEAFVIQKTLEKLESLQGVTYNKTTSFSCKYHYKQEQEQNLLEFFNDVRKLEPSARIQGHWVWVRNSRSPELLLSNNFRMVRDSRSDHYGEYYINAYMPVIRWNSGLTTRDIVLALHR